VHILSLISVILQRKNDGISIDTNILDLFEAQTIIRYFYKHFARHNAVHNSITQSLCLVLQIFGARGSYHSNCLHGAADQLREEQTGRNCRGELTVWLL
jgi:hypothetical protein